MKIGNTRCQSRLAGSSLLGKRAADQATRWHSVSAVFGKQAASWRGVAVDEIIQILSKCAEKRSSMKARTIAGVSFIDAGAHRPSVFEGKVCPATLSKGEKSTPADAPGRSVRSLLQVLA